MIIGKGDIGSILNDRDGAIFFAANDETLSRNA